jgi:hypothetical protein
MIDGAIRRDVPIPRAAPHHGHRHHHPCGRIRLLSGEDVPADTCQRGCFLACCGWSAADPAPARPHGPNGFYVTLTGLFGIQHDAPLGSTNDEATRLAAQDCDHGTVVWADEQTAGRGRQGRRWQIPAGQSLIFSEVLRLSIPVARATELGFLPRGDGVRLISQ